MVEQNEHKSQDIQQELERMQKEIERMQKEISRLEEMVAYYENMSPEDLESMAAHLEHRAL